MATSWITPVESWTSNNGIGNADLNRIEGNIDYIRNQVATFYGVKTFSSTINVGADTDITASIGRGKIFSRGTDIMTLAHYDHASSTDYMISQDSSGNVRLNSALGEAVQIRNNSSTAIADFESDAITMYQPVTISDDLTVDGGFNLGETLSRITINGYLFTLLTTQDDAYDYLHEMLQPTKSSTTETYGVMGSYYDSGDKAITTVTYNLNDDSFTFGDVTIENGSSSTVGYFGKIVGIS